MHTLSEAALLAVALIALVALAQERMGSRR
jgi:hypothetical protein